MVVLIGCGRTYLGYVPTIYGKDSKKSHSIKIPYLPYVLMPLCTFAVAGNITLTIIN